MTLPNVYIVGAPKAGTTSLARWLASHPIFFSDPKEPFYWASDYPGLRSHHGFDSRESYEALFESRAAREARCRVEGSTVYLYSHTAAPRILQEVPDARFVIAVRNPVDLLASYHRSQVFTLNEAEHDFHAAWRQSLVGRGSDSALDPKLIDYPRVGALGAAVQRIARLVPRDRMHVVVFDDLVDDPLSVWVSLTRFAGIDTNPVPDFRAFNISQKAQRWPRLWRLLQRPPRPLEAPMRQFRIRSRTIRHPATIRLKKRLTWRAEPKPTISPENRAELTTFFRSDVKLLEQVISRPVPGWTPSTDTGGVCD